jgi:hypothetical protein
LEKGKEEKRVEYGTTHFCTAGKLEATKEIANRAQGTGRI